MDFRAYLSRKGNYIIIILILIVGIVSAISVSYGYPSYIIAALAIVSLLIVAIRDMRDQSSGDLAEAERKLDSERMKKIEATVNKENKELKEKHELAKAREGIMKDFIKRGIIKEKEILDSMTQESFMVLYHFNKKLPEKYKNLLPDKEKPVDRIIKQLGFVPVGSFAGAYFFHIVNTALLPRDLRQPAFLEAYIKNKVRGSWNTIEAELKKTNKREYNYFKKNSDKKVNLIYLIGKVFTSELRIGYLNYSNFDRRFLPYISGFAKRIKNVDKKKLHDLLELASLEYFVGGVKNNKDRDKIIRNETKIRKGVGVVTLLEYGNVSREKWMEELLKLFDDTKAEEYVNLVYNSIKRDLPIIREFL